MISLNAPTVAQGEIRGQFNLSDLGGMVKNGLNKILVGPAPRKLYRGQHFNADFVVKQNIINYFAPEIKINKGAKIAINYNGNSNEIILNAQAESLKYMMTKTKEMTDAERELAKQNPEYKYHPTIEKDSILAKNNFEILTGRQSPINGMAKPHAA